MRLSRVPILFLLCLLLVGPVAWADVVVTVESSVGAGEPQSQTVKVRGDRLKITVPSSQDGPSEMIFAGDLDEMWLVDHDQKRVLVLDQATVERLAEQLDAAMKQMEAAMANVPEAQRAMVEKMMKQQMDALGGGEDLGPREVSQSGSAEFAGRECTLYRVTRGGQLSAEVCTVPYARLEGGDEMMGAFQEMKDFYDSMLDALARSPMLQRMQASLEDANPFGFGQEIDGFPVMTRRYDGESVDTESTLMNMERTSLDAGEFEVPAGYERQKLAPER